VTAPGLALDAYEGGRPSADAACRVGDPRFLAAGPTAGAGPAGS
jgi:hydrogenase maturation protease